MGEIAAVDASDGLSWELQLPWRGLFGPPEVPVDERSSEIGVDDMLIIGDAAAVSTSTKCTRPFLETDCGKKTSGGVLVCGGSNEEKPRNRSDLHRRLNSTINNLAATFRFTGPADVAVQGPNWVLPSPVEGACLRCLVQHVMWQPALRQERKRKASCAL